jgi:hypothetical protein
VILTSNVSLWEIFFVLSEELIDFDTLIEIVERFLEILTKLYKASVIFQSLFNSVHILASCPNFIKNNALKFKICLNKIKNYT